jgi:hypothetical protein
MVPVRLNTLNRDIARIENDVAFGPMMPILANADGSPDCTVNAAINKADTHFTFLPVGCTPYVNCDRVHADVHSLSNSDSIPNGAVLYQCNTQIPGMGASATCQYTLSCSAVAAFDPHDAVVETTCVNGSVIFGNYLSPLLTFDFSIDPPHPAVHDAVAVTVSIGNTTGGAVGIPQYTLRGTVPFLSGETVQRFSLGVSTLTYHLQATRPGTAMLQVDVNYETVRGCPGNSFFAFETFTSAPFALEIADAATAPTAAAPGFAGGGGCSIVSPAETFFGRPLLLLLSPIVMFVLREPRRILFRVRRTNLLRQQPRTGPQVSGSRYQSG